MKETQFVVAVFLSACWAGIAEASKNINKAGNKLIRAGFYITGFLGLWYCYAIATTGIDYTAYLREYQMLANVPNDRILSSGFEIGYLLIAKLLAFAGANAEMALLIFRTISIVNIAVAIWMLQSEINIFFAVIAYASILFFDGYHIVMMLSASLILMGISLVLRQKYKVGLLFCSAAAMIHYSGTLFLIVLIVIYILNQKNVLMPEWWVLWIGAILIALCAGNLVPAVVTRFSMLAKYKKYITTSGLSLGSAQIIYYSLPTWLMIRLKKTENNTPWKNIFYILIPTGFCVAYIGYSFGIFDRMYEFFSANFILFIPYCINKVENRKLDMKVSNVNLSTGIWCIIFLLYFALRAYVFIAGHPVGYEFGPLQGVFS